MSVLTPEQQARMKQARARAAQRAQRTHRAMRAERAMRAQRLPRPMWRQQQLRQDALRRWRGWI
jgi:hypothetical protein